MLRKTKSHIIWKLLSRLIYIFFLSALILIRINLFAQQLEETSFFTAQEYKSMIIAEEESSKKMFELSKALYPEDSNIDVTYYGLIIKVTRGSQESISGSAIINTKVNLSSINSCFLDLRNNLIVDSVLINGLTAAFTHSSNKINIDLDRNYFEEESFSLQIFYKGIPYDGLFFGSKIIYTLSEPYGAPYWYPCKDTPADKADSSDVWVTVVDNLTPVSNGTLEEIVNNGDGTHTYHWKNHLPIAHYLIFLAIGNYMQYNTYFHYGEKDSMIITHYILPGNFNQIKQVLDETDDMIAVFSERYGLYPFIKERYGHAQIEGEIAMEHQTCTSMRLSGFNTRTVSHELSHQWFGDKITCKDWHHIWLNEGFATYSTAIYLEAKGYIAAYNDYIQLGINMSKTARGSIWVKDISNAGEIFDFARSYAKGAGVLHMLRGIVGDSIFFKIIRTYSDDPFLAYGVATTEDFQAIAENVSGQDLDYFFQEWIYGENYPKYTVNWNANNIFGETYRVDLNISQVVNSNPAYFTMPIKIKFYTPSGDTIVTVFNNAQNQDFQFTMNGNPDSISFDYGGWILKDLLVVPTSVKEKFSPYKFALYQNYPNPFNPTTVINYQLAVDNQVTLKLYDILGKEVVTLVNEEKPAGSYEIEFDAANLSSGVYFYQLKAGSYIEIKKMVLLR